MLALMQRYLHEFHITRRVRGRSAGMPMHPSRFSSAFIHQLGLHICSSGARGRERASLAAGHVQQQAGMRAVARSASQVAWACMPVQWRLDTAGSGRRKASC